MAQRVRTTGDLPSGLTRLGRTEAARQLRSRLEDARVIFFAYRPNLGGYLVTSQTLTGQTGARLLEERGGISGTHYWAPLGALEFVDDPMRAQVPILDLSQTLFQVD